MGITAEKIEREKKRLPFGWGRVGTALDRLAEISEPIESLLAACVAQNPEYQQRGSSSLAPCSVVGTPFSS